MRPATLARALSVSRATMHAWMTDDSAPRGDRLHAIASALGLTQAEFFGPLAELPAVVEEAKTDGEAA
jgi:transcriptional regulator with XRE-family HTH domain